MKIPKTLFKNKKPQCGIYCIENIKNGKLYIGSSKNIYQRLHVHRVYLNNKTHQNMKLQNSWNKHSEEQFICYSLELCTFDELLSKEQYWIDNLKPWYNITLKVERNILSEESRIKISNTLKEGYKNGKIKLTKTRSIKVFDMYNNYLHTFNTIKEASLHYNIHESSIHRILKGIYKQCKGLRFQYEEDNSNLDILNINKGGRSINNVRKLYNKRSEKFKIKDLTSNGILEFNSIKEATIILELPYNTIRQFLKSKSKIYKNKYQLLPVPLKSDKLLENPEEDNQQPITNLND